ncbi:CpsD/CapB family tyrosine-protein kinase [Neobacillus niacini]|uniref:CpsD/CapB family tyrosine-protein kinase n=1 Tax=Neobacillus niacini TaxID=86668 RepID=UPI002FFF5D9A
MKRKFKNIDKRGVHLVTHSDPKSAISEQYRQIRTNILFSSVDKEVKSIVVTSAEPSDGKSTTAANLAIVLAQQGKQVLLVDTDLRKPSVHYTFNVSNMDGLTSVLTKEISLDKAITKTKVPNLDILTSGPIPPNPSELLDSKSMETILEQLKDRFEYVVLDSPPILVVTDSQILAKKCDGVVLVVASGKTHKESALQAKELLENARSNIFGVVLNAVESVKNRYYMEYK